MFNTKDFVLLNESAIPQQKTNTEDIIQNLSKKPIKLVTHGWISTADQNAVINIKDAFLKKHDVNVIGVDWSSISENVVYPIVAYQTKMVGSQIAKFLDALCDRYEVSGDRLHLIGHSLGAHVMGNAGQETKYKVGRITGLDPARPLFEFPSRPNSVKLDNSDADFVDVIHTCSGILGVEDPIGHADFFPNTGIAPQPGCTTIDHFKEACSHSRAHVYYTESILHPTAFPACREWLEYMQNKCQTKSLHMGESVNRNETGSFFLLTNNEIPYGRGAYMPSDVN